MSRFPPGRAEVHRDLLAIGLGAGLLFFIALGARDLWNPNEPIYGQAVAEMTARGDWLVPTVNGKVFAEKPILYYWMALLSARVFGGVNELTLRIPSALTGILGVLLVYLLVVPYAGRVRARLAAVLFATTYMVYWGSRAIQMDILVAVSTAAVVLAVTRVLDHGLPPFHGWLVAGVAAGLGFLAKGPVGWICPGIVLVFYMLVTRRLRALFALPVVMGAVACLAVSAPWFLLLLGRGETAAIHEMLYRQNVTRVVNPWDHANPWWYYLGYFWLDMAPWAWFVPLAVGFRGQDKEERRLHTLAWCWIAGILFFFSLSPSKRSAYMLPLAPAVAILASGVAERVLNRALGRARETIYLGLNAAIGALLIACGFVLRARVLPSYPDLVPEGRALVVLLVGGGVAILGALVGRTRYLTVPTALFSFVICVYLLASVVILPSIDAYKSARPFCERVGALVGGDRQLASFRFWDWRASYTFYAHRPIRNLASLESLRDYWQDSGQVFLIVEDSKLGEARAVLGDREPLARRAIGDETAYLFSNR